MTKLFVLEDKDEFKLVDADGNVLAKESRSVNTALATEHDPTTGRFTGPGAKKHTPHDYTFSAVSAVGGLTGEHRKESERLAMAAYNHSMSGDSKAAASAHEEAAKFHAKLKKRVSKEEIHAFGRDEHGILEDLHTKAAAAHKESSN